MNSITRSIFKTIIALAFANAATALAGGPPYPLPQDPAKSKANDVRMLEWSRHTIQEPFEKLSKKDPKWDAQAKTFMDLVTRKFSGPSGINLAFEDLFAAGKKAVDLGCDDPLLMYFYTRAAANSNSLDDAVCEKQLEASAARLAKTQYPPIRRASAFIKTAVVKARRKDDAASLKEAKRLLIAGLGLISESVKTDGTGPEAAQIWSDLLDESAGIWQATSLDSKAVFLKSDEVLAKVPEYKALRLARRGAFYILYAWEARTTAFADKVTDEQFQLMHKRLLEAKEALEASWKADPKSARAPTSMITVEMGIGPGDRDKMELWFQRALEIDPDNRAACLNKLEWLKPKWHGSPEEMLDFGKQCRDTKNVRSKIPLIVADVHYAIRFFLKEADRNPYIKSEAVFLDIQHVFSDYLKLMPGDLEARTDYAAFCYLGSRTFEAVRHFEIIGDKLAGTNNFMLDWLKRARLDAKKIAAATDEARGLKPESANAKK